MKSELNTVAEHRYTPTSDLERTIFRRVATTHECVKLELHAPDGGFVKEQSDLNTPFTAEDLVQLRFTSPAQLMLLAELCEKAAHHLAAMQTAHAIGGRAEKDTPQHVVTPIRRNGTTRDLPPTRG